MKTKQKEAKEALVQLDRIKMYMDICETVAKQSYCKNYKVGSVIVKDDTIIAIGYNGTPSKRFDNICEDENGKTLPHVLHAESNAIAKCAKSTISSVDSVMYCTLAPCIECSKLIIQSGIKAVFYKNDYRNDEGINLLQQAGVEVIKAHYKI